MTSSQNNQQNSPSIPKIRELWQEQLAHAFKDPFKLLDYLKISPDQLDSPVADSEFPTLITQHFADLMEKGNPQDPLLRQVLPTQDEQDTPVNFSTDPLGETQATKVHGILHKYSGRALMLPTSACAIHCRYCFRRHYDYSQEKDQQPRWYTALVYLREQTGIEEVILSGGDPLTLKDTAFTQLIQELNDIEHLQRLRIHTRLPLVLPSRINASLLQTLKASRFDKVMVMHVNHPNEISPLFQQVCQSLRDIGVTLLNQSVLLKGVNDDVSILKQLHGQLFSCGVLPYYLHTLDKVTGVAHFDLTENRARQLIHQLQAISPGYLVPKLAREEAGELSKTILM